MTDRKHFYLALCGAPGSGKTTFAEMLAELPDVVVFDDGSPLRQACCALYGLTDEDVNTQEGKARVRKVGGQSYLHRELLGDLGLMLEDKYGGQVIAQLAAEAAERKYRDRRIIVFPSCRLSQGSWYKDHGGMVVEICRDGYEVEYDFDDYDVSPIDRRIHNDDTLSDLRRQATDLSKMIRQHAGF